MLVNKSFVALSERVSYRCDISWLLRLSLLGEANETKQEKSTALPSTASPLAYVAVQFAGIGLTFEELYRVFLHCPRKYLFYHSTF